MERRAIGHAKIAKPLAEILVPTTLPLSPLCRLSREGTEGCRTGLGGEAPHHVSPTSVGTKAAGPTRDHQSVAWPFWGGKLAALDGVSALDSVSPAHNTPSRPSRRGYSTIRTCSRLRRHCSVRLCGAAARSSRRGGHSVLPRKLRATPVMSSNQDPSLGR